MTKRRKNDRSPGPDVKSDKPQTPPAPVDVVDGIPDRASRRPAWKYVAIVAVFLVWLAALVYIQLAGGAK